MKSIIQKEWDRCYICHGLPTDVHHLFGGSRRKKADKDGLTIHVCRGCHQKIHEGEQSGLYQLLLHQKGQMTFENEHSREYFMERYGKNYL